MPRNQTIAALLTLFLICLSGCQESAPSPAPTPEKLAPMIEGAPAEIASDVTLEQAQEFARSWESATNSGDAATAEQLFDSEGLIDELAESLEVSAEFKTGLESGLKKNPLMGNLVDQLKANLSAGGSYRLVRVVTRGDHQHAVFRLLGPDGTMNYHDFRIARNGSKIQADQLFIAMTGERFYDSIRSVIAPVALQEGIAGRISGGADREMKKIEKLKALNLARQRGDLSGALKIYNSLSPDQQRLKSVQIFRLMSLASDPNDDQAYLQAIADYEKLFPNDPSLALISIDAAVMRKDMDMLEKSHQSLTHWSAGDPMLDLVVAAVLIQYDRRQRAIELVKDIDVDAINLPLADDFRLTIAMAENDHAETARQLTALETNFGYQFQDLTQVEDYANFVASEEYKIWTARNDQQ